MFGAAVLSRQLDLPAHSAQGNSMSKLPEDRTRQTEGSGRTVWVAVGAIAILATVLLIGKFGGFFEPEQLLALKSTPTESRNKTIHESFVPTAPPAKVPPRADG